MHEPSRADVDRAASPTTATPSSPSAALSRRAFLGTVSAASIAAGAAAVPVLATPASAEPPNSAVRKELAFRVRQDAARSNFQQPTVAHPTNGDEQRYPEGLASFSKGLPHNAYGEVQATAFDKLVAACDSGTFQGFEAVPSGEPSPALRRHLCNPMAGVAFDLEGVDSHEATMRAAPAFASAEEAGEIVESYWMALLRDVPFSSYATDPLALAACADLSALSDFRGPKVDGLVTPQTLFRADLPDALIGPWVSQLFWRSQPFGAQFVETRLRTVVPGVDFMTTVADWLSVQRGTVPTATLQFDPTLRYLRNGRDLGQWVHVDVLFQAYFQALLHLLTPPDPSNPFTGGGFGCAFNPGNPYLGATMQDPFATFGGPAIAAVLCEVASRALKAVWHQKWYRHRRLRPEAFAGRVHHRIAAGRPYPIHPDVLESQVLPAVFSAHGTYLLPMAYPEGSPMHPAYGAGHATVAGACVTMLKALFDTQVPFPNPVVATPDGLGLSPYTDPDAGLMTVEGELNKLAQNVAFGRNIAGVHWRTDGTESLKLGEEVAIRLLRDQRATYGEPFGGFTFRRFDGTIVTV